MDTQTPDLEAVVERLGRVEKQNRRLKVAGIVALVVVGAVGLLAAAAPKPRTIEAERFVLVDRHGERAVLAPGQHLLGQGEPSFIGLTLFDEDGKIRVALGACENSPENESAVLIFFDADKKPQVTLGVTTDHAELTLSNNKGEVPVWLTADDVGGKLDLTDGEGKYRIWLTAGLPSVLGFADEGDKTRIKLGFPVDWNGDSMPCLRFYDKDRKAVWQAPPPGGAPKEAGAGEE
jgi:hypothetical protein